MQEKSKWALSKCMAICSKAEKCISDIQKKLDGWEIPEDKAQVIIATLLKEKFIDEERFARIYTRDKFRFNQWGKIKITFMLKGKRISIQHISKAMLEINDDEYLQTLSSLLREKSRKTYFKNSFDKKSKLIRYAQGRGFEYDLISKELQKLTS